MRTVCRVSTCALFLLGTAAGQNSRTSSGFDSPGTYPKVISFFAPLFLPKILQDEYHLKEYICSDEFVSVRRLHGDLIAVDAIFDRALKLSWDNVYEALLISFVSTVEHRNFGVKLPIIGPLLWVPLTSEFPDEFRQRVISLPKKLYHDTPTGVSGDRDKLQHFFGSAFLTYTFESRNVAERFGTFIEWGEDKFVVEGALDERDILANKQGQDFGVCLLGDPSVFPSEFLAKGDHSSMVERGCAPDRLQNSPSVFMEER